MCGPRAKFAVSVPGNSRDSSNKIAWPIRPYLHTIHMSHGNVYARSRVRINRSQSSPLTLTHRHVNTYCLGTRHLPTRHAVTRLSMAAGGSSTDHQYALISPHGRRASSLTRIGRPEAARGALGSCPTHTWPRLGCPQRPHL